MKIMMNLMMKMKNKYTKTNSIKITTTLSANSQTINL